MQSLSGGPSDVDPAGFAVAATLLVLLLLPLLLLRSRK